MVKEALIEVDANNEIHQKLAELSKKAHELALKDDAEALSSVEVIGIDREVANLFGITEEELEEVKDALRVVYGAGAEAEEEIEEKETVEGIGEETPKRRALEGIVKEFKGGVGINDANQ